MTRLRTAFRIIKRSDRVCQKGESRSKTGKRREREKGGWEKILTRGSWSGIAALKYASSRKL